MPHHGQTRDQHVERTADAALHSAGPDAKQAAVSPAVNGGVEVNDREEDTYWRDHFRARPYADETLSYDHYRPAYRYGWESRTRFATRRWDEVERDLERGWRENRGTSRLGWSDARQAARDAWQRVEHRLADERDRMDASGTERQA